MVKGRKKSSSLFGYKEREKGEISFPPSFGQLVRKTRKKKEREKRGRREEEERKKGRKRKKALRVFISRYLALILWILLVSFKIWLA